MSAAWAKTIYWQKAIYKWFRPSSEYMDEGRILYFNAFFMEK